MAAAARWQRSATVVGSRCRRSLRDDRRRAPRRFHDGSGRTTTTTSIIIVGLGGISEALRRAAAQHRRRESLPTEPTPEPETKRPTAIVTAMTTETTTSACGNGHKMAAIVDPRHGNDDAARKPPVPLLGHRPSALHFENSFLFSSPGIDCGSAVGTTTAVSAHTCLTTMTCTTIQDCSQCHCACRTSSWTFAINPVVSTEVQESGNNLLSCTSCRRHFWFVA